MSDIATTWVSMADIVGEVKVEMDNEFILHRCATCQTQIVAFIDDEADSLVYKQFCDCPLAKDTIEVTTITAECIEAQHALEQDSPDPPDVEVEVEVEPPSGHIWPPR